MQKKTVDEIQHLFMKKILNKVGLDSMYLIMIKAIHDKPRANITFNGEKLKVIPLKSGTRQGGTLFLLLFSIVLEILPHARKSRNKRHTD